MELKYKNDNKELIKELCSNCTFMELKWKDKVTYDDLLKVLIVPLWN